MLFNTAQFFVFLAVVLALFYGVPRGLRKYILLAASYYFYASWNPKFIALLLTLTVIDYASGLWLERVAPGPRRKAVLVFSLAANLGFLGFFKYYNFLAGNLALAVGRPVNSFFLDIVLPLGISFHTFQSMSYVVDVYRGQQRAVRNPVDYALFICFFPQLVAGPIVRARDFFRDLWGWQPPTADDVSRGVFLMALGLTKKMAFADQFAKVANEYFGNVAAHRGMAAAWSGVFAFALQIYFDFSGYTDMAIGMAKLLGFHFPINFRRPYLAASVTDFWRRWHISLSSWLRDYLYIPLGGSRGGAWKTYRNLMLTMLLGGLWHGASWNFLIWGGYQGVLLSVERVVRGERPVSEEWDWSYPVRAIGTFALVCVGWVFFRAADLGQALQVLGQMFGGWRGKGLLEPWHWGLAGLALLMAIGEEKREWFERAMRAPAPVYGCALAAMLFCLEIFAVVDAAIPFIYFQF
ncbi:MAG: rane bound O-acyl transferase, family protein [Candidatus Solibacter sp.]|nr:rane bound O-acyl transferase, family protein [Candidatus Solibacter sp.]